MEKIDINPFMPPPEKPPRSFNIINILQGFSLLFSFLVIIYLFVFTPSEVDGISMEPNFQDKEILLLTKLGNYTGEYQFGDVIVFHSNKLESDLIKRVVAVGGDTLEIRLNTVYVNDQKVEEFFFNEEVNTYAGTFLYSGQKVRIPEGSYFVLGDNRSQSKDSRSKDVGFVESDTIKGRAFVRIWPLNSLSIIERN